MALQRPGLSLKKRSTPQSKTGPHAMEARPVRLGGPSAGSPLRPGDLVVMDNLSSHQSVQSRRLLETRGARRRDLPAYSPDRKSIAMILAKIKQGLRSPACSRCDALWRVVPSVLEPGPPSDAAHCFRHGGYSRHLE